MGVGSMVGLILNLLFVLILVIGFLLGIWRGLKKSAVSAAFSVVGVIVAFFVTPLITNAILGISINVDGTQVTLNQYIIDQLRSNPDIANLLANTPSFENFIANVPSAVANTVIFIVVTFLVELVLYVPYRIIASVCLKQKGQKKYRWWGGAVGLVKAFVVAIFVFMPLSSLAGTATQIDEREDIFVAESVTDASTLAQDEPQEGEEGQESDSLLSTVLPVEFVDVVYSIDNSAFGVLGGLVGLDNAMFDYLSQVNLDKGKVYIRQEIVNYLDAYNIFTQISNEMQKENGKSLTQLNFEKIDKVIEGVLNGGLYRSVAVEVLTEVIVDYQNYSFMQNETFVEYSPLFDSIGESLKNNLTENVNGTIEYFSNDIRRVYNGFKTLAQDGVLDQLRQMQEDTSILDILMSDENFASFSEVIDDLFSMNMVRDGVTFVSNKLLSTVIEGLDEIAVDVKDWTEENWDQLSLDISNVLKSAISVVDQVDISQVIDDPTSILENKELDVTSILTDLGNLIDQIRGIQLFKNEQGQSIVDNLLIDNGFTLPSADEVIYNTDGTEVTIDSYTDLLTFFAPSFEKIQEIGLFSQIENSTDAETLIKYFAEQISLDETLLSTVILPLTQVEPAKSLITDLFVQNVQSDLINLSEIEGYDMWKSELESLTSILTTLNQESPVEGKTYLDFAFEGDVSSILNNLGSNVTISQILSPVLTAKSTDGLKKQVFQTIDEMLNEVVGTSENFGDLESLDFDTIFIKEGGIEDQTKEICNIFENVIEIYKDYTEATEGGGNYDLASMDKTMLGILADSIKANAYRVEIASQNGEENRPQNNGIFRTAFDNLYNQMLSSFENGNIRQLIEGKEIWQISFTSLMASVEAFEDVAQSDFVKEVSDILTSGSDITISDVENLVGTITEDTAQEVVDQIDTLLDNLGDLEVKIDLPSVNEEQIDSALESNSVLTEKYPDLADKIKNIFNFNA